MTSQFALAQQAADIAYAMELSASHDEAIAADAYRSVMDAYNAASQETTIEMTRRIWRETEPIEY